MRLLFSRPSRTYGEIREYLLAWRKRNKAKTAIWAANRRAQKAGNDGVVTAEQWAEIKERYDNHCLACGKVEPAIVLTMDHVTPLKRDGLHLPENIQPLCRRCNARKNDHYVIDYRLGAELMNYWFGEEV